MSNTQLQRLHEVNHVHCHFCHRRRKRKRWVTGISIAAIAGCIIAFYVAFERNTLAIRRAVLVIEWVLEREKQEKELHAKIDSIAKRVEEAEKRAAHTQRLMEKLARAYAREPRQQDVGPSWPKGPAF